MICLSFKPNYNFITLLATLWCVKIQNKLLPKSVCVNTPAFMKLFTIKPGNSVDKPLSNRTVTRVSPNIALGAVYGRGKNKIQAVPILLYLPVRTI